MQDARRERQDAVLAELSELGLSLARELHARAMAAQTPAEAEKLALAFQRVSRGVRQTFALELKIERARREAEREAHAADPAGPAPEPAPPSPADQAHRRGAERKARVRGALYRLMWDEAERDEEEFDILDHDLEMRLGEAARREDFLDLPIETLIRQIKSDMGLCGELIITTCDAPSPAPGADLLYDAPPPDPG